jgi:hypothetical protein
MLQPHVLTTTRSESSLNENAKGGMDGIASFWYRGSFIFVRCTQSLGRMTHTSPVSVDHMIWLPYLRVGIYQTCVTWLSVKMNPPAHRTRQRKNLKEMRLTRLHHLDFGSLVGMGR